MKKINILIGIFVFSIIGFSFTSCDKIEEDNYLTKVESGTPDDPEPITSRVQKILIEDFTGHLCPNCPNAAIAAHSIMEKNKNVFLIGIHNSGNFSKPMGDYYTLNFETTEGEELRSTYKPQDYPSGMINRKESPSSQYETWESSVNDVVNNTPLVYMTLANSTYDTTTNKVSAKVTVNYHQGYVDDLNLVLAITEDGITGYQTMPNNSHNPDYVHNHVLRQMPSGVWGAPFFAEDINEGDSYAERKEFTLRDGLVWENCHLIAYLIKNNTDKREIVQVEQIAIKDILK